MDDRDGEEVEIEREVVENREQERQKREKCDILGAEMKFEFGLVRCRPARSRVLGF